LVSAVVKSPSSTANLGPGFDVLSLALEKPYLTIEVDVEDGEGVKVIPKGKYCGEFLEPEKCAAAKAAEGLLRRAGVRKRVTLVVQADIPLRKGLGSSGAEAAATVYGLNHLLNLGMSLREMVEVAAYAEPGGHADNVAASLLGGFVAIFKDGEEINLLKLSPPEGLGVVVIVPDVFKASTEDARKAIPLKLDLKTHIEVTARAAAAALALAVGDYDFFLKAVSHDPFVECVRADAGVYGGGVDCKQLMDEKKRLLRRYHVAETISGAGPSRVIFYKTSENRGELGKRPVDAAVSEVVESLEKNGHRVLEVIETKPDQFGCIIQKR